MIKLKQGETTKELRKVQRRTRDYFAYVRRGKVHRWRKQIRKPIYHRYRVPRPGHWRGVQDEVGLEPPQYNIMEQGGLEPVVPLAQREDPAGSRNGPIVAERSRHMAEILQPLELHFNRILGWGGNGLALLFDLKGLRKANTWSRVVIKCALDADDDKYTAEEAMWHKVGNERAAAQVVFEEGNPLFPKH